LFVTVDKGNLRSVVEEPDGKVHGKRRLPYPALGICKHDVHDVKRSATAFKLTRGISCPLACLQADMPTLKHASVLAWVLKSLHSYILSGFHSEKLANKQFCKRAKRLAPKKALLEELIPS
jgi:hypothetical protein